MADDIREELARWIYTKRWGSPRGYDNPNMDDAFRDDYRAEADDLLALPVIAHIRAEAWDEGYDVARETPTNILGDELYGRPTNPYRPTSIRSETDRSES